MKYVVYGLVLLPLLAFFFAVTRMMTAKRLAEGTAVIRRDIDEAQVKSRFLIVCCTVFANVLYGVVELFIVYTNNGGFVVPENLKYVCVIAFLCNAVTCIIQGIIGDRQIRKGALFNDKEFTKIVLYFGIAEVIAVIGLIFFFLGFVGVV